MKTDIAQLLISYPSFGKQESLEVTQKLVNDEALFAQLMTVFLGTHTRLTQRAAWVMSHYAEIQPLFFVKYIKSILGNLYKESTTDAVKRNSLRVLQFVEIPKDCHDMVVDKCFQYLENRKEPVAIQVFAMTVLANLTKEYPELKNELKILLEDRLPLGSAGFKARAKKVLRQIG